MQMDLKLIEAFVAIMRAGSLTRASAETGTPKATLSRQLSRLEETLGVQLLVRFPRRIAPTDAGRAFHAHCEALLNDMAGRLEAARTEVQEMGGGDKGKLCVLAETQFTTTFVCQVARIFLERYPGIECELYTAGVAGSPRIEDVDCYICAQAPDLPNVVGKLVGRLSYGLYASPDYLKSAGLPATPKELVGHRYIRLREEAAAGTTLLHSDSASYPFAARATLGTNDPWVMKTFCIDGLGIALLPDFFALPEVRAGCLAPVLPEWKPERRRLYCAYQRQRYMSRKLRAFMDLVGRSMADIESFNRYVPVEPKLRTGLRK